MRPRCRAVVFDLDGTLLDTEPFYARAFAAAAASLGVQPAAELQASLVGIASPERGQLLRATFGAEFPVAAFLRAYYAHRAAVLPARLPLRPGVRALLRHLALPRAIATSASRRTALAHLGRAGLAADFAHVVTRDDVARGKPAPDAFLEAARRLEAAPDTCLAVEDSAPGAAAALAAGMQVVLVSAAPPPGLAARCCAVLPSLEGVQLSPWGVVADAAVSA